MTIEVDRSSCSATRHGTRNAYTLNKCRCADAREAKRLYSKRLREGRNLPLLLDATVTHRKLKALRALGWTWHEVADRYTGDPGVEVHKLLHRRQVTRTVAMKVDVTYRRMIGLPVPIGEAADRARESARHRGWVPPQAWGNIEVDDVPLNDGLVDAQGAHRRLEALVAIGWSHNKLKARYGLPGGWFSRLKQAERIGPEVARQMDEIYRELWMIPAAPSRSSHMARSRATRSGWVSALAWDDIDDPTEKPSLGTKYAKRGDEVDQACVSEAVAGRRPFRNLTKAEARLVVRRLVEQRFWSDARIAEWLHTTDRTVLRTRQAAGIKAVPMTRQLDAA